MGEAQITIRESDDGKMIELRIGASAILRMPENATSGYRWALDGPDAAIVTVREDGFIGHAATIGSAGTMQWTLIAKAAGTTQIRLKLWRHWEGDASVLKRFAVTLQIRP